MAEDGGAPLSADLELTMGALGVRGEVLRAAEGAPMDLAVKSDALWVRTTSETVPNLIGAEADVTRLRLIVDGSRAFAVGESGTLMSDAEMAATGSTRDQRVERRCSEMDATSRPAIGASNGQTNRD